MYEMSFATLWSYVQDTINVDVFSLSQYVNTVNVNVNVNVTYICTLRKLCVLAWCSLG